MPGILDPRQYPVPMPRPMPPNAAMPLPVMPPGAMPPPAGPGASPPPANPMAGMSNDEIIWRALTGQNGANVVGARTPQHVQDPDPTRHHIMGGPQMLELIRAALVSAKKNKPSPAPGPGILDLAPPVS